MKRAKKVSIYARLSATKNALFCMEKSKKVLQLLFQSIAMLAFAKIVARLSGTYLFAVPAKLSDTLPPHYSNSSFA